MTAALDRPRGFQFVFWRHPVSWGFRLLGPFPSGGKNKGCIYRWRLLLGPLEIRRWA